MVNELKETSIKRIAFLIDGDNAQPKLIAKILTEASKQGTLTIRRIYGDWTTPNMQGWKETLNTAAIQPIQQFRYTVGENMLTAFVLYQVIVIIPGSLPGSGKAASLLWELESN